MFEIDEPCLPASVKAVYFRNLHVYRPQSEEIQAIHDNKREEFLASFPNTFQPEPDVIYNAALAGAQKEVFGPGLEAAGFKLMLTSTNPNTFREINLYVLAPGDF
jgi:hypothetical protein